MPLSVLVWLRFAEVSLSLLLIAFTSNIKKYVLLFNCKCFSCNKLFTIQILRAELNIFILKKKNSSTIIFNIILINCLSILLFTKNAWPAVYVNPLCLHTTFKHNDPLRSRLHSNMALFHSIRCIRTLRWLTAYDDTHHPDDKEQRKTVQLLLEIQTGATRGKLQSTSYVYVFLCPFCALM